MNSRKTCPICGDKRRYLGIKKRYLEGFFLIPDIWIGFEFIYKCGNGHWWTKRWYYVAPCQYEKYNRKKM